MLTEKKISFIDSKIVEPYFEKELSDIEEEEEEIADARILAFRLANLAKLKSAEELHYLIANWNWDDGDEVPDAVLMHPECDYGTALRIYWSATPDYFTEFENETEVPSVNLENYRLVKKAENLLLGDRYKAEKIKFDPRSVASWEEIDNPKIPTQLKNISKGQDFEF